MNENTEQQIAQAVLGTSAVGHALETRQLAREIDIVDHPKIFWQWRIHAPMRQAVSEAK
ncbi:hypothetical protein PQR66_27085 [Paraburkholderia agricolaris]|uniref:Uncharacterized protein n=1 Tax=Paraburkholderia agricolaris TaxID=2152888 RepID=A0ABW8ZU69_9BURK